MANIINISQILIKRGNTTAASNYVGPLGELVVDTGLKTLRLQDGATPGGMATLVNSQQLSNVIVAIEGIQSNVTANVEALLANIQGANLSSITANITALQNQLDSSTSNITVGNVTAGTVLTTAIHGSGDYINVASNDGIQLQYDPTGTYNESILATGSWLYIDSSGLNFQSNVTGNYNYFFVDNNGNVQFTDNTVQSTAYQGPAGQTDFATLANVVTANVAIKGYIDNKISLLANAPAILDTLGQIATAIQTDEANIGTLLTSMTATNANITAANVAWQANAATQQGLIKTLQGQVYANANASAYLTTYLPTYTGNITAGNLMVSGNINYLGAVNYITGQIGQFQGNAAGFGALYAGILSGFTYQPQTTLQVSSNFNGYAQINSQNINGGAQASSDFVATADNGNANAGYIDVGIASSTYNYPGFSIIKPNDGYVLVTGGTGTGGGNLILTTGTANDIVFAPNNVEAARINYLGAFNTQGNLTVGGNLFVGTANIVSSITSLQGNAAAQEAEVTGLRANIVAANSTIQALSANVGSFYTWANTNFGTSSYSNANVASYLIANPQGSTYSNANVVSMLSANSIVTIGNVNTYPLQSNITQVFVGNSTTLTSGGTAQLGTTYLMDNTYFAANGATYSRNTQTGGYVFSMGGASGFAFSGSTGALTANTYQAYGSYAQLNSSGFVTYNSIGITSAGTLTASGTLAVNGSSGITTTQTTIPVLNTTATTINFGGAATTVALGASTVNLNVGSSAGNITAGNIVANQYGNSIGTTATYTGNVTAGNVVTTGTYVVANITTTGAYGNITGANVISANSFIVSNGIFWANGTAWSSSSGGGASTYGDGNVIALMSGNTVSNISLTSNASITGNLTVGTGQGGFLFRKLAGGSGAAIYNTNVTPGVTNYNLLTDGASLTLNTASGGGIYTGINNSIVTTVNSTGLSVTGNITASGNVISPNYLFANGVNILSTITGGSGTYSNTNVAAYLTTQTFYSNSNVAAYLVANPQGSTYSNANVIANLQNLTTNIVTSANVQAAYFVGNGAALSGVNYASIGNIYGSSSNVTLQADSYNWTFDNTGNLVIPTNSNIVYANGTVFTSGTGGSGGTIYTNANVVSMLAANTSLFVGNTGNVATVYPIQSNITQLFIGGNTSLTSGNAASPNSTVLMYNGYFAANGAIVARNTTTGIGYIVIDSTGIAFNGYTGAVTANTVPTFNQFLKMNGSIGAQFSGSINTPGTVTGVGLISTNGLTLNTLGQISTNQASASIFPTSASTIAIGGVATTVTIGPTSGASNVFVSNAVGTNNGNLTVRAFGTWNTLTLNGIAGGYNSPPYSNQALTGGSGTGMTANYSTAGNGYVTQASLVVVNPGTGYKNGDVLTLPGGLGTTVILTNYNSSKSSSGTAVTGLADYVFGMDGNLSLPGNVTHATNTAIYGDFTNSTVNNRTIFRPIAANSNPGVYTAPTGTGTAASWQAANSSNIANASKILITTNGTTDVQLVSGINGTGTYLPLSFLTSGTTQMQLDIGGNLNMVAGGNVTTAGNIVAGNYLFSNGVSILSTVSGGNSTYSNANVVANLANFVTNIVSTANITAGNVIANLFGTQYGNTVGTTATYSGNISAANIVTTGATSGNISGANVISANTFTVSTGIFWANGVAWSSAGGSGSSISNGSSSLTFASSGSNGVFQIAGVQTATFSSTAISMIGNISATANITAANIIANQYGNSIGTTATYSGNITAANIITTGTYGNITNANVITANTLVIGGVNLTRATNGYNNWKGNTYANVDNISCSVFSNGMPALSSVSGTLNYFWSATSVMSGHAIIGNTNTGGSATTTPQSFGLPWTLSSGGDTVTAVIQDQGLSRVYNVTYMQTVGVGNCAIIVERLM
jgi:hypothetical protein